MVTIFIITVGAIAFGFSLKDLYKRMKNKNKPKDKE
jgi:hypothetical protein